MRRTILLLIALLAACGPSTPEATPAKKPPQGRAETENIRNTEAIGYAGNAIANKVDKALDTNDQRKAQLDQEMEKQEGGH